jgi:pimeloyl-ACP methyl ester carboxylesterase
MATTSLPLDSTNVRNIARLAWARLHLRVAAALSPPRAVEAAAHLFATPPRSPHRARELELLEAGERLDVETPHGAVAAWRFGAHRRPVVLLSHGWGGRGTQLREFVPALLDAGYQPVLFDHLGHGFSRAGESTLVHFMAGLDALARRLEEEGARIAGVIGHSLGAAAAGSWLNDSGRELRAVLIAPPTSIARYSGHFARRLGIPETIRRAMQERFERRLGMPWQAFELPQAVARVRAQALVVHDTGDRDVGYASGLALARAWPGARLVRTTGLGHRAILREPGVVADAIDYLRDAVVFAPPPAKGETRAFAAPAPAF